MFNISNQNKVFVIAEAGSNWKCGTFEEDLEQAKKLITIAAKSGADAVKFQTFKPETTYVSNAGINESLSKSGFDKNIDEIFANLSMPYEMIPKLAKFCIEENIMFMSSPFSIDDAKAIDPYVDIHKIASFEINHIELLEFLANTNKPIIISTGASTYDEIDFAINLIHKQSDSKIYLLQCTSKYPCPLNSLNLSVIPKLIERYNLPVGFSDHSLDPVVGPMTSLGFGACIIEKHFTINKKLIGPDHAFALNPDELELMIKSIRNAELTFGEGKKVILDVEEELHNFASRSLQAIIDISKGDIFELGVNFDILRPGSRKRGIDARFLKDVIGKKANSDIKSGDGIPKEL
jgi:N,N'-diacetyllegionaminate synthase